MPKKINIQSIKKLDKSLKAKEKLFSTKLDKNYDGFGKTAQKQLNTFKSGYRKDFKPDKKQQEKLRQDLQKYFKDIQKTALTSAKKDLFSKAVNKDVKIKITAITANKTSKANDKWAAKLAEKQIKDYNRIINDSIKKAIKVNPNISKAELKALIDAKTTAFKNIRTKTTTGNETNRIQNQTRLEAYRDSGIVQGVVFTAVLDLRTTQNCIDKDGTKIEVNDPRLQYYMIPQHLNCRSTLVPVFIGDKFKVTNTATINRHLLRFGKLKQPEGQPIYFLLEDQIFYEFYEVA